MVGTGTRPAEKGIARLVSLLETQSLEPGCVLMNRAIIGVPQLWHQVPNRHGRAACQMGLGQGKTPAVTSSEILTQLQRQNVVDAYYVERS